MWVSEAANPRLAQLGADVVEVLRRSSVLGRDQRGRAGSRGRAARASASLSP